MKIKHHTQRIVFALIVAASFTWAVIKTESWFWIGVECFAWQFLCYVIIQIDAAHEYKDQ